MNPHERIGRANKVNHLVAEIDRKAQSVGTWGASDWAGLTDEVNRKRAPNASRLGPPSIDTVNAVVAVYEERAGEPSVEDSGVHRRAS